MGKIKRKLKAKAARSSGVVNTPKKTAGASKTPKSGKRGTSEAAAQGTPTKKSKNASKPVNDDNDDDDEFATFSVTKEEVNEINSSADTFFQDNHYAAMGEDQLQLLICTTERKTATSTVRWMSWAQVTVEVIRKLCIWKA
jgi:hypothetical protein